MTTPVVAFKCTRCDSNDPCACPNCNGNCDTNNCQPQSGGGDNNCNDQDPDNDDSNECRGCEGNYEDDFFIYAARLQCPAVIGNTGSAWTVTIDMTWPDPAGQSLHGPLRENENREFASNNIYNLRLEAQKDDDSEDPSGNYTITGVSSSGTNGAGYPCTYSSFDNFITDFTNGGFANSIWAGATVTVS